MKSNSKVIGVVVCIVCCVGALCILPLVNTNESDSLGWNPSSVYDGVISPSNGVFTDAVLEEQHGGSSTFAPRVSSTGSRMFHHTGASSLSAPTTTLSYAGASVHTTSSALMGGTGSSVSPISTSTARGSMSGTMNGGNAIYATTGSISRSGHSGGSSVISTTSSAAASATSAAPMMSAAPAVSSSSSMYANFSGSTTLANAYNGYSGGFAGVTGAMRTPSIADNIWASWLKYLAETKGQGWLYNGDLVEGDGKMSYFDLVQLEDAFKYFQDWLEKYSGDVPEGYNPTWDDFLAWFNAQSDNEDDWYNDGKNVYYRTPLPDGVGVLLVLSLLCALFTFLRQRDKQTEAAQDRQGER